MPFAQSFAKVCSFGLDHDVVYIGLNGPPNEVSEPLEHTTLVRSPCIFQTERYCDVVERSIWVMKDIASWWDSFIVI